MCISSLPVDHIFVRESVKSIFFFGKDQNLNEKKIPTATLLFILSHLKRFTEQFTGNMFYNVL